MHIPTSKRRRSARMAWLALVAVLAIAVMGDAAAAAGAPARAAARPVAPTPVVTIDSGVDWVTAGGMLDVRTSVTLPRAASALNVRVRLYSTGDTLIFQKTERRTKLEAQTYLVAVGHTLDGLGLQEGPHRIEVRVEASGMQPVTLENQVLVVDPARPPVPLAVIVRLAPSPCYEPQSVLGVDPSSRTPLLSQAVGLAQLASLRPDLRFTLAPLPLTLDEWGRIGEGYALTGSGAQPREAAVPVAHREAIAALSAVASAGVPVLALPYAGQDVGELDRLGALDDLGAALRQGSAVLDGSLHSEASSGTVLDGGPLTGPAARVLTDSGVSFAIVGPGVLRSSKGATLTSGVYEPKGGGPALLVPDRGVSALLGTAATPRSALLAGLFARLSDPKAQGRPLVAVVDLGPESGTTVADLQATLAALARIGWLRLVTAGEAAVATPTAQVDLPSKVSSTGDDAYWSALASARSRALALQAAAGTSDEDAIAALRDIAIAESAGWHAGGDEGWSADRGTRFVTDADMRAGGVLSAVSLTAPNVTLSATTGKVRVSVANTSGKTLSLLLRARPSGLRLPKGGDIAVDLPPGETIITVPVDMGAALSGSVGFQLMAGDIELDAGRSAVHASYMDRLVLIGTVVLLLLGMLLYIRRRGAAALGRLRRERSRGDVGPAGGETDGSGEHETEQELAT